MDNLKKAKVICIVGPTASGKTAFSVALAKKLNGEIISADSMQIYKDLYIGTAAPTKDEMKEITHHLTNFVNIDEDFSVAQYKSLCYEKIDEILKKNKTPIIVGGTGLYISSVILNMDFKEEVVDDKYRKSLYDLAAKNSNLYVYNMLKKVDEESAKTIHPNNLKRVIRALEMYKSNNKKSDYIINEEIRIKTQDLPYDFYVFCLTYPKDILHDRINKRVDQMIEKGLENEARIVYNLEKGTIKQAVGYKEFFDYFENKKNLNEVIEEIKLRTRQYSKRQMTWFKKIKDIVYLDMQNSLDENIDILMRIVYEGKH